MKISGKFILKVAGTLTVIALVVAALLGVVNNVTKDKIAEQDAENTRIAMSAVAPEGTFNAANNTFTVSMCTTVILKIAMQVELLVPSYGYCAIPPAQEYSREVCTGFFELPLYPQARACACKGGEGRC